MLKLELDFWGPEQKMKILREHLDNHVPIGELAARYAIHPNMIHQWKKGLFESAHDVLVPKVSERATASFVKAFHRLL